MWARIFGFGGAGLRSLSALAGVATVPGACGAARKLVSERAGLIVAALTACNPFLIWYSQEARCYSLLLLLSAVALLAFAHALARPEPRLLLCWAIASALAMATHYYAVLAIAPQALWLIAAHWRERPAQIAVGAVGLCGLGLIPLALSQNGTGNAACASISSGAVRPSSSQSCASSALTRSRSLAARSRERSRRRRFPATG